MDGLDPNIMESMMGKGQLPNFERLAQKGFYSRLKTTTPPQSPVAWTTIATGCEPAEHGIFDFLTRDPETYLPQLTILQRKGSRYIPPFRVKTFWETASEKGIKSTILRWPLTFPPRKFNGKILAGLGVPDIQGGLGQYTFYTSNPDFDTKDKKGRIVKVNPQNHKITTELHGPSLASLTGSRVSSVPLMIEIVDDSVRCHLNDIKIELRTNNWSDWVQVKFNIGLMVKIKGLCKFYLKSITPEFELYVTPVQIAPGTFNLPISSPQEYSLSLSEQIGHYATLGLPEDTNALNDEVIDEDAFLMSCDSIMQERQKMFFYELDRFKEGILACVFDTTDRIQHMFWRYMDNTHPMYDESTAEIYGDVIPRYYQMMDNILSKVRDGVSSDTLLMICSDHGFSSFKKSVHLNAWLVQNGFMALKDGKKSSEGLFDGVDWTITKAYAIGFNSIFLNLQGRESEGIVNSEHAAHLKEELTQKLSTLTDDGVNVIKKISDADRTKEYGSSSNIPDLIAGYTKNYRCSWQTAIGGIADNRIIEENKKKWSGDHCCDATIVPGVFFSSNKLSFNNISVLYITKLVGSQI